MIGRFSAAGKSLLFLVFALAAAAPAFGAKEDTLPPKPTRYVTDRAGVLGERAEALNTRLEDLEKETSNQILVWTDRRVPENYALEEFTVAAARKWEPGQKGKNNGAVLFVFVDDRKMRIEVGYGLEGVLPDALAHQIQEGEILPRFRANDYPGGIEAGVNAMIAATKGEYKGTGSTVASRTRRRGGSGIPGCVSPILFLLFFIFIPLLRLSRWRTYGRRGWTSGGGGWGGGWGGFGGGGSFGGGGGGGGGFSGGGGSFGGGGSSGSW